jgi:hypothetical protein
MGCGLAFLAGGENVPKEGFPGEAVVAFNLAVHARLMISQTESLHDS